MKAMMRAALAAILLCAGLASAAMVIRGPVAMSASGDPYFANVVLLIGNDNAANGTTTFDDQSASNHTITAAGTTNQPVYTNAQVPTGMTTSVDFNQLIKNTQRLTTDNTSDFNYGTGQFTVEFWMYSENLGSQPQPWEADGGSTSIYITPAGSIRIYSGGDRISSADGVITTNTWHYVALSRVADGTMRMYVGGATGTATKVGSNFAGGSLSIGQSAQNFSSASVGINGYGASMRITKGVGRYSDDTSITIPTLPLQSN